MHPFLTRLKDQQPILMDGATGSELERRGLDTGTPIWSALALMEAPEMVEQIHRDYLEAGAELIIANTFRTQRRALDRLGLGDEAARLTTMAVAIAQKAVRESGGDAWVAGSLAPLEDSYRPNRGDSEQDLLREHSEMAQNLAAAGADLLLLETMNNVREAHASAEAASATGLPFGVSFVCDKQGNLLSGESLAGAVAAVTPFGPSFLSINCTPAEHLHVALEKLRAATKLPIAAYGNSHDTDDFQHWQAARGPEDFAELAASWLEAGASLVGGCCGTRPEHIGAIKSRMAQEA